MQRSSFHPVRQTHRLIPAQATPPPAQAEVNAAQDATATPPPTLVNSTPTPTLEATGTTTPTPSLSAPTPADAAAQTSLENALWAWTGSYENNDTTVKVLEPLRYTLEFLPDGTVEILADCNQAEGTYVLQEGGKLSIQVGVMTKMACPPDSQSVEFLSELAEVESTLQHDGALVLNFKLDTGGMTFAPNIPLDLPEPPDGAASAATHANIKVRLGPG